MSKDGDSVFSRFKPAPNKPPIDLPGGYKLNFRKKKWRFGKVFFADNDFLLHQSNNFISFLELEYHYLGV